MSRFLRYQKKKITAALFLLAAVVLQVLHMTVFALLFLLMAVSIAAVFLIEKRVVRKLKNSASVFTPQSDIRNVNRLVIGDQLKMDQMVDNETIFICAPQRTLSSSFMILKHIHSILRDDGMGEVCIAVRRKNIRKAEYSVFDTAYFYYTTIKMYKLQALQEKARHPFINHPIRSLQFLLNLRCTKAVETDVLDEAIKEFCEERGYKLRFFTDNK